MHLLREPVRFHAVACGGHELLRERAGHDADDADYRDDYVFCHGLLSLGCGSQGYESAKFKWQDTNSFRPDAYGGGMNIIVDRANGLLHVNLSGFKSTVNVNNYNVLLYSSGVKPSKNVKLSCLWAIPSGNYGKQATWTTEGSIVVIGGLSNGDRCLHTPLTLPIPEGVTFS